MGRRLLQCAVFVMGLSLALVMGYVAKSPSSTALARTALVTAQSESVSVPRTPIVWTQEVRPQTPSETDAGELGYRLQNMSPEVRQAFLVEAVRDGSAASLRNISSRSMSVLPEYRREVLPALKRESLAVLVSRFRELDWSNWPLSSYSRDGGPTPARSYVDLVFAANPELGRFLETGAQLFHRLYAVTEEGRVFGASEELRRVLASAETSSPARGGGLIPASRLLDAGILQDPVFGIILEQLRSQLVGNYVQTHRDDPLTSLELLLSVHPAAGAAELTPEFVRIFRLFALEATPRYRQEVFERLQQSSHLEVLAKGDTGFARSLAELYLVGGMDAFESGDQVRALLFIDQSSRFFTGLRAQELLAELIRIRNQPQNESQGAEQGKKSVEAREVPLAEDDSPKLLTRRQKAEGIEGSIRTGMSFLSVGLFFVVICAALFFVFIYWRSVHSLNTPALTPIVSEPSARVKMTSPTEMNFGDEPEIERRLANG